MPIPAGALSACLPLVALLGAANVQVTTSGDTAKRSESNAPPSPAWATVLEQSPDATVVYDAGLRAAITATGLPWRVRDNGTGIEMVLIPPGTFSMGCSASDSYGCNPDETVHCAVATGATAAPAAAPRVAAAARPTLVTKSSDSESRVVRDATVPRTARPPSKMTVRMRTKDFPEEMIASAPAPPTPGVVTARAGPIQS